jgi:hypothetical protein
MVRPRCRIDADGFGGYTALSSSVVSQRGLWVNYGKGQPDEARKPRYRVAKSVTLSAKCAGWRTRPHVPSHWPARLE